MYRYHPRHIHHHFLRNLHIPTALIWLILFVFTMSFSTYVLASATSNFRMIINPGVLAVGMVDDYFVSIAHPMVDMGSKFQSPDCQSITEKFGTITQKIYVKNPGMANNGWNVTLSAASPTDLWQGDDQYLDFNDNSGLGCDDGLDSDIFAGQMTIDPSQGTLSLGACTLSCVPGDVTAGSASSFEEGVTDTITLLTASAGSSDMGDWVFRDIPVTQTIPANQPLSDHYSLDLFLSVIASS